MREHPTRGDEMHAAVSGSRERGRRGSCVTRRARRIACIWAASRC